mmetsp:Transcript_126518/g.366247  ORF Transcript_126518/g.366247 Transcript_126518/m.366247 type:complete len:279 (-) Transcript_126518:648-1484(-)
MACSSSDTSCDSLAIVSVSLMIVDLPSSTAADSASISSLSLVRVILLFPISVSQKPSCCASWFASSSKRVIMASIIFLTLPKGSAPICCASMEIWSLCRRLPSLSRNSRTRRRMPSLRSAPSMPATCNNACDALLLACANAKCFSALPMTSGEERISTALAMASISSARSCCFSWKDMLFSEHSVVISDSVFSFAAFCSSVSASSFLSCASSSALRSFTILVSSISWFLFSMESWRSWMIIAEACLEFISAFWLSPSFSLNWSCKRLSISTMPPDWNS